jgi:hypothetical protein
MTGHWLTYGMCLAVGVGGCSVAGAESPCASTAAGAVRAYETGMATDRAAELAGYRVTGVRRDAILGRTWASVGRCEHPEWPEVSVPTTAKAQAIVAPMELASTSQTERPQMAASPQGRPGERLVKPGETVRLWRSETNVRVELTAVCDESGGIGDKVRVHVTSRLEDGVVVRYLSGLVRGPADVEME